MCPQGLERLSAAPLSWPARFYHGYEWSEAITGRKSESAKPTVSFYCDKATSAQAGLRMIKRLESRSGVSQASRVWPRSIAMARTLMDERAQERGLSCRSSKSPRSTVVDGNLRETLGDMHADCLHRHSCRLLLPDAGAPDFKCQPSIFSSLLVTGSCNSYPLSRWL